ncbi:MAG: HTTM domain-containing protein [Myxococcota bacterium]
MSRERGNPAARPKPRNRVRESWERLFEPVDIAALVIFRIAFGGIMVWQAERYLTSEQLRMFIEAPYHFTYPGFSWVQPWAGDGMYVHFWVLGTLAALMALGFLYRLSAALFFLGFSYFFLLDQTYYLNHYYLICLVSFLMIFVPAHRAFSVDAWLRPSLRSQTAPAWALWILRFQMGAVYFFGGIAKMNGDWLRGWPLRNWLPGSVELPGLEYLVDQVWFAIVLSYGGMLFDSFVPFALLWRKTRPYAFTVAMFFHLTNSHLFSIGVFPWLSLAMTALFFDPDWPRRLARRFGVTAAWAMQTVEGRALPYRRATAVLVTIWVTFQVLIPLRHFLYPGNVSWTEEGHRFAWHMKLRGKDSQCGFFLHDPDTGASWEVEAQAYLWKRQYREMCPRPQLLHQFAKHVAELGRQNGHPRVQVRSLAVVSLNGRKPLPLVDPNVDLAAEPYRWFTPAPWIMPYDTPRGQDWMPGRAPDVASGGGD